MQSLHASGGPSHINCTRVTASRMQIVPACLTVACNMNKISQNLHATGCHLGTICMRVAAPPLPDKRQADKRCVKGRLYIIIIFFSIGKSTSSTMLLTIQLTALGYLAWKMRWYYGWQSYTEATFARASGQLRTKPPDFCKHAARKITWIKKWRRH